MLTLNLLSFIIPCWVVNIALNLIYPLRMKYQIVRELDRPIDAGLSYQGKRILGDSTTMLGLFVAMGAGFMISVLCKNIPGLVIGFSMYFGHLLGSFIKRRFGYARGQFLPIVDHGDGILLTGAILYFLGLITFTTYIFGVLITLIVYPILCRIGYHYKLRSRPL